tara:strand:- start:235 stop:411 length:177 start_codon:yes stop_codon:yes gene_type:complete
MSKKKKQNKKIREKYGSVTLKELEDRGQVPKGFHLFDSVDMKEYHSKFPGFKEFIKSK